MKKSNLTNEELSKHFDNPFDLVNHAIGVAKHMVGSGHELADQSDRNAAVVVLKKVLKEQEFQKVNEELVELKKQSSDHDEDLPNPMMQVV